MVATTQTRIDRTRWWVLDNHPFYGSLTAGLSDVMDSSTPTSATDGVNIYWNEEYVSTLDTQELRYVLLHETLHPALGHLWRLPLDKRGNMAGDFEIACILAKIPDIKAPKGILYDPKYDNVPSEEILRGLPQPKPEEPQGGGKQGQDGQQDGQQQPGQSGQQGNQSSGQSGGQPQSGSQPGQQQGNQGQQQGQQGNQSGQQPGQGQGKPQQGQNSQPGHPSHDAGCPCGGIRKPKTDPASTETVQAQSEELREKWEGRVIQAAQAQQALGMGDIPGSMDRMLNKIRHQPVDWQAETTEFVRDASSQRNDWSRSSRRHAWQPVIYPRKKNNDLGVIVFVRDTSGSVDDKQLALYSALITDCLAETGCSGIVLDCDRDIKAEYRLEPHEECPLHAKGGGGTDFRPPFTRVEEIEEEGVTVAGLVYITDLQGRFPAEEPEIPVLWLATRDGVAPFGRTVRVEN